MAGPRQSGKTTLSKSLTFSKKATYLTWDDPAMRLKIQKGDLDFDSDLWIFDELHKYRKWRNFLKYIGKILRRAYDVICVDGKQGMLIIGILLLLVLLCYLAQGFFKRKLDEYLKQKKINDLKKKEKKK